MLLFDVLIQLQSWLMRKYGKFDRALAILDKALEEAIANGEEMPITRVYDEIANTLYQKGDLEAAEEKFRLVIRR